jgi:hypothetical protein
MKGRNAKALLLVLAATSFGCSSVRGTAIATGPLRLPAHVGAVSIYMVNRPAASTDLGIVEVHAFQTDATVEKLLPLFVQKVASLGGNAAVVDNVGADFRMVERLDAESYTYPCGFYTCVGTRLYPVRYEVMVLSIHGHAALERSATERGQR